MRACYNPLAVPLTIDVTTGDKITLDAIVYEYPFAFDEGSAKIMAYPLETVLAEKIEAILSRNIATTRIRNFYDVYELWRIKSNSIDPCILGEAPSATCEKRNSQDIVDRYMKIVDKMRADNGLERQWRTYVSKHSYAANLSFEETLETLQKAMESIVASRR